MEKRSAIRDYTLDDGHATNVRITPPITQRRGDGFNNIAPERRLGAWDCYADLPLYRASKRKAIDDERRLGRMVSGFYCSRRSVGRDVSLVEWPRMESRTEQAARMENRRSWRCAWHRSVSRGITLRITRCEEKNMDSEKQPVEHSGSSDCSSAAKYCCKCRHFRFPGWCQHHDNHVTSWLTCEDWDRGGCQNCNGTGRAWRLCEFTNDYIMADCQGCDGGRLFD